MEIITAVFDCNVFWQIFFSETGTGSKCWKLVTDGSVELIVSDEILDELQDVLTRPATQARFSKATDANVAAFTDEIIDNATFVSSVKKKFKYVRDPKDEPYINLAVQVDAQYIVSRDKDLLDLMNGYDDESKEFRQRFRQLRIVDTLTFVGIVEEQRR